MEANVTELLFNFTNETVAEIGSINETLKMALDGVLLAVLIIIMLAMGCDITPKEVILHVRKPIGVGCGMISQFLLMPLAAYSLSAVFQLKSTYATGVLIISCTPGGVLSNTFTYFCDGDLALSVTMTTVSTVMALGFLPLNMWIYGRSLETSTLVIPYDKIALSLIYVTSPTIVGMVIRWKARKLATYITLIGSYSGAGLIFLCIVLQIAMFPSMFDLVPWQLYVAVVLLPSLGLFIGYGLSFLFRQTVPVRKTVAMECGIQNVPIALTIVSMSFSHQNQMDIAVFPSLYGFSMMTAASIACFAYQWYRKWRNAKEEKGDENVIKELIAVEVIKERNNEVSKKISTGSKEKDRDIKITKSGNGYGYISISTCDCGDKCQEDTSVVETEENNDNKVIINSGSKTCDNVKMINTCCNNESSVTINSADDMPENSGVINCDEKLPYKI